MYWSPFVLMAIQNMKKINYMKKIILLALVFINSAYYLSAQTQMPNADFESWEDASCDGEVVPAKYVSGADLINADEDVCPVSSSIIKSTNKYSGTYALQILPLTYENSPSSEGNLVYLQADFTTRPSKLIGYAKFTKGGTDTLGIDVAIGDIEDDEPVAYGELTISESQSAYTKFEITLVYNAEITSDVSTLVISFGIGNENYAASASTSALIDGLSFEYGPVTSTVNYAKTSPVTVFAANNSIHFSEAVSDVHVVDMVGASKMQEAASTKTLHAATLTSGLYVVTYKYNDNYFSKKVVIE